MKFLNKTVISLNQPTDKTLLWLKPKDINVINTPYEVYAFNGGWHPITSVGTVTNTDKLLWVITDGNPITYTIDGTSYTESGEIKKYVQSIYDISAISCKENIVEIKNLPATVIPSLRDYKKLRFVSNINVANKANYAYYDNISVVEYINCNTILQTGYGAFYNNKNLLYIPPFKLEDTTIEDMCWGCASLTSFPSIDFSKITSFKNMFYGCESLVSVPDFDIPAAVTLQAMFYKCLNLANISNFTNATKVTNTISMFANSGITDAYHSNIGTAFINTTNCTFMFGVESFRSSFARLTRVGNLNYSKCTTWTDMFINQINLEEVGILNMTSATVTSNMFNNCTSLKNIVGLTGLKVSINLSACPLIATSIVKIFNTIGTTTNAILTLGTANLAKVTDAQKLIAINKGWTLI